MKETQNNLTVASLPVCRLSAIWWDFALNGIRIEIKLFVSFHEKFSTNQVGFGLIITKGLIENLSPSLSLASLNEVAMYSAYLATVLCEREEVQYQTWNMGDMVIFKIQQQTGLKFYVVYKLKVELIDAFYTPQE